MPLWVIVHVSFHLQCVSYKPLFKRFYLDLLSICLYYAIVCNKGIMTPTKSASYHFSKEQPEPIDFNCPIAIIFVANVRNKWWPVNVIRHIYFCQDNNWRRRKHKYIWHLTNLSLQSVGVQAFSSSPAARKLALTKLLITCSDNESLWAANKSLKRWITASVHIAVTLTQTQWSK